MKKLLPVILPLIGLAGGAVAGFALKPAPEPAHEEAVAGDGHGAAHAPEKKSKGPEVDENGEEILRDYVKMHDQFIVPLVMENRVGALIVVSLSIETDQGLTEEVYRREPKLRDEFLKVLFRHAQSGAFDGVFTAGPVMRDLRGSLLVAAQDVLGMVAHDVLVTDILRQDM